jgi:hypothetical protein
VWGGAVGGAVADLLGLTFEGRFSRPRNFELEFF